MDDLKKTIRQILLKVQKKAHLSGHLDEMEQVCFDCGAVVMGEDDGDHPCDNYYCECGNSWCDCDGWVDRQQAHADHLRKQAKEGI